MIQFHFRKNAEVRRNYKGALEKKLDRAAGCGSDFFMIQFQACNDASR
jgi:uncharacterized Fe-S cluster-containing radical SAM superfamily protein